MPWQWTPYMIILIMAASVSTLLAVYILWKRHDLIGAKTGVLILMAAVVWTTGYVLELGSTNLSTKIFWNKMQYFGHVILPVGWLIYVLKYTGREKLLKFRNQILLVIVPLITLLLVFTNEVHGLIWHRVDLVTKGSFSMLIHPLGTGFWIYITYSYILLLFATSMLIKVLIRSRGYYRWQIRALLLAALLPWLASALQFLGINPLWPFEIIPLAFAVSGPIWLWGLTRLRLSDILSVTRDLVIDGVSDGVIVLDAKNRIIDLNPAAQKLTGFAAPDIIGKIPEQVWQKWPSLLKPLTNGSETSYEVVRGKEDDLHTYDVRISHLSDWRGHLVSRVIVLRDITERKRAEEQTKRSLKEKEVLLTEIHHRVKNNLQIISSLLNLQSGYIKDKQALRMFRESQDRVRSMALIHEKLYQSKYLNRIDFAEYIKSLANSLYRAYNADPKKIALKIEIKDVYLGVDLAIPCGLIINELVSNSLKYGFPPQWEGKGRIRIALIQREDDEIELTVSDNGTGMPEDIYFRQTETLGLKLVTILTEDQLKGKIKLDRRKGTKFQIRFKKTIS